VTGSWSYLRDMCLRYCAPTGTDVAWPWVLLDVHRRDGGAAQLPEGRVTGSCACISLAYHIP